MTGQKPKIEIKYFEIKEILKDHETAGLYANFFLHLLIQTITEKYRFYRMSTLKLMMILFLLLNLLS